MRIMYLGTGHGLSFLLPVSASDKTFVIQVVPNHWVLP
jgi:hypothetical protein